jgi:F-type H+-transporting ATPase subunit b
MAVPATTTGTVAEHKSGGFPPFNTSTYPSQIFWLTVTFLTLLIVMWKVAVPKIAGVIAERKGRIQTELARAEESRKQAEHAAAAYQAPILEAREPRATRWRESSSAPRRTPTPRRSAKPPKRRSALPRFSGRRAGILRKRPKMPSLKLSDD